MFNSHGFFRYLFCSVLRVFFSHFRKRIGDVDLAAHVCPGLGGGLLCKRVETVF